MKATAIVLMIATIAACEGTGDEAATATPGESRPSGDLPERPALLNDTVMIEGMPEPSTARLFTTPGEFPLPFSTYVPEGIEVDVIPGDPPGVNFTAAFGGVEQPLAYMHVAPYEPGTDVGGARDRIGGFLRSRLAADDPADIENVEDTWQRIDAPGWALEAYSFDYDWNPEQAFVGRIIMAREGGTLFHVIMHYPPEYGDGLAPRFDMILDTWRWEDTGLMLRDG